jgi:hypothetical protein
MSVEAVIILLIGRVEAFVVKDAACSLNPKLDLLLDVTINVEGSISKLLLPFGVLLLSHISPNTGNFLTTLHWQILPHPLCRLD